MDKTQIEIIRMMASEMKLSEVEVLKMMAKEMKAMGYNDVAKSILDHIKMLTASELTKA